MNFKGLDKFNSKVIFFDFTQENNYKLDKPVEEIKAKNEARKAAQQATRQAKVKAKDANEMIELMVLYVVKDINAGKNDLRLQLSFNRITKLVKQKLKEENDKGKTNRAGKGKENEMN